MKLYKQLSSTINAIENCGKSGNEVWHDRHSARLQHLVDSHLPHGSGVDSGCTIDTEKFESLLIYSSFHVMDENGFYDGWIDFTVRVKPSLQFGIDLIIKGNFGKHQDLKDYLHETFDFALNEEVELPEGV